MKAPDKIYILKVELEERWPGITEASELEPEEEECYIRKDALLEWLEVLKAQSFELREKGYGDVFYSAQIAILEEIINKLNKM